ncbi:hypothetical protein [uncultured Clostridium sp.]|uniref:hypothetical protein n=1 Tax=uncultured Clostridium sp. TaxID=59620 RepID=UPI002623AE4F|nr:hypothetical protein [uncultured Clostridium sp.]
MDFILEPIKEGLASTGIYILTVLVNGSYYICLTASIGGLLAYLAGFKSGGRWTTLSLMIYATLQAVLGALK